MATMIVWRVGILVEILILSRGLRTGSIRKFPFFYLYVALVALCDVGLYVLFIRAPGAYPAWSARAEFLNLMLGCGIVLEIFKHVLSRYPGAERFARISGLAVVALVLCFSVLYPSVGSGAPSPVLRKVIIERDFLTVQTIFFLGILAIISYYGLEIGKDICGMIVGYGLWLGTSVIALSLRSYLGSPFDAIWIFVQPFSYLLSLMVWLGALWPSSSAPASNPDLRLNADYEAFVAATKGVMGEVRSHLGRATRP